MENPFSYGGVVGNGDFCNRKQELVDLTELMKSSGRCFVYGERRMGKTSLIFQATGKLPKKDFISVYVDLWPTDGTASFAVATAKAITTAAETKASRLLELGKSLFGRLRPAVTMDDEGKPAIEFGFDGRSASKADLVEILNGPQELAKRTKKQVVVVFDEFQQIAAYEDDLIERQLRTAIQHHKNVSYFFLGSRKHLLQAMFLDQARPLYRSASHYPIGPIHTEHWLTFIATRFTKANKKFPRAIIRKVCELTEGHPFYTQHLCHVLWSMADVDVDEELVERAVNEVLRRESHAYVTLWESLTRNERRFLRGLAASDQPPKPFSADFTRAFGLRSASNAQRAADSLQKKDVVDREQSSFVIVDRFFRSWIRALGD